MNRFSKIVLLQIIVISQLTSGQTIVRSSLSCLGSTITDNGLILRQTTGQPSNTDVFRMEGMELRQGFQQPVVAKNHISDNMPVDFTLSPNPAKDITLLRFEEEISGCIISIRDVNGSTLFKCREENLYYKWLDLNDIMPGIYIVTVISGNRQRSKKLIITN